MTLTEQIKADREAGSGRDWVWVNKNPETKFLSNTYRFLNVGGWYAFCRAPRFTTSNVDGQEDNHNEADANARRIARVPEMEAALLAAEELAGAIENSAPWEEIETALAAYRKAAGEGQ